MKTVPKEISENIAKRKDRGGSEYISLHRFDFGKF